MTPQTPASPARREGRLRERLAALYGRLRAPILVAAGLLLALAAAMAYRAITPKPQRLTHLDIDAAVERALESMPPPPSRASIAHQIIRPSVVVVRTVVSDGGEEVTVSLGAGVVIVDSGLILTSLHVVQGAEHIRVLFADGSESPAQLVVAQPHNDTALPQAMVIPDDLVPATVAAAAGLQVGDVVVAVGSPFGVLNSLSAGVVSGLGRDYRAPETDQVLTGLIQFDAAVNPGNSGGPLVDRNGEVVGIVTALLNPTGEEFFVGIGFAVPIEAAAGAAGPPPY